MFPVLSFTSMGVLGGRAMGAPPRSTRLGMSESSCRPPQPPATAPAADATASAASAATAAAATEAAAGFTGTGLVDDDGASVNLLAVHGLDGRLGLVVVGHLDEPEAARAAGVAVHDHGGGDHLAVGLKEAPQLRVVRAEREITEVKLHD